MDSSDDSEGGTSGHSPAAKCASSSPSRQRIVPIEKVQTLTEMARLVSGLQRRMEYGEVRSRELCEITRALARSKYFDAAFFKILAKELRGAFKRRSLSTQDIVDVICSLADLNAYDSATFEAACATLKSDLDRMPDSNRQRLDAALKQVKHSPGEEFALTLKTKSRVDEREACPMFWRGQCKWGPRCKLSHDSDSFDGTIQDGRWKPPTQSGGKSVGFKQSADLFKTDRCGALW